MAAKKPLKKRPAPAEFRTRFFFSSRLELYNCANVDGMLEIICGNDGTGMVRVNRFVPS